MKELDPNKNKSYSSSMTDSTCILLTGATGFLGSCLAKELIKSGHTVIVLKRQTSKLDRLESDIHQIKAFYDADNDGITEAFNKNNIDTVIHCATEYGRKLSNSLQIAQTNLFLPLSILQKGKKHGLKYFINIDTLLNERVSKYALSKKQFKEWLQHESSELTLVNIAIEHFYGPKDDTSKFVSWVIDQFLTQEPLLQLTKGEQKRDFIYYTDVISAILSVLEWSKSKKNGYFHFEVGTGKTTSIKELVLKISELCNNKTKIEFDKIPYRENELMEIKVNLDFIQKTHWTSKIDLETGLKETINQELKLRGLV